MEEGEGTTNLDEQPQSSHNEPAAESEVDQSTHSAESWISPILYPVMEEQLLPQLPTYENATGERARCSARGEPAAHISPPVQDPTLSTCRHIVGLLGQITEYQDGILRELRMMRREMRLMKGEQRRTNARVVSVTHELEALKKHFKQQTD